VSVPHDEWRELDDTLADGPAPASLPNELPDDARQWLAEQRTMHGLLRALHTADANAREGRVRAILTRIDGERATGHRRHWLSVAAAALLLATVGVWLALPPSLPTAEAAMARAVGELGRDVDRRFHVRLVSVPNPRKEREFVRHDFELVTRPGSRFLIDGRFAFGGMRVAEGRIGCDGEEVWVLPNNPAFRRSGPLSEREQLLEGLGDFLDIGYVDVHRIVQKLPGDFVLRTVGREVADDGSASLRIRAKRRRHRGLIQLRSAELLVDEPTGMVTRLEAELRVVTGGTRRLVIEYLGEATPGTVDYKKPW